MCLLSMTGIAVSFVMKFADNIVKVIASSSSMFITAGLSRILFGTEQTSYFYLSVLLACIAILLYNIHLTAFPWRAQSLYDWSEH